MAATRSILSLVRCMVSSWTSRINKYTVLSSFKTTRLFLFLWLGRGTVFSDEEVVQCHLRLYEAAMGILPDSISGDHN